MTNQQRKAYEANRRANPVVREKLRANSRRYRAKIQADPTLREKMLVDSRAYEAKRKANPVVREKVLANARRYRAALRDDPVRREKRNADSRARESTYRLDPAFRARKARQITRRQRAVRTAALELLGGVCRRCGFSDVRALQIDHKFGGGSKERKKYNGHIDIRVSLATLWKYQLLCANCNWIKRYENNEVKGSISKAGLS